MRVLAASIPALVLAAAAARAGFPPRFVPQSVADDWNQAVGLCFASDGRMFVWEKSGLVWTVENGVKSAAPLLDLSEEVGDWRDYGLLGFAVHPDFYSNGYIYALYVVDYHHLAYYGTPQYDPQADEHFHDTIGRLTRYTCNAADGFRSVDYGSRVVLIGESMSTGFPHCHQSHGIGTVLFGEDGTLLAGCGDGASYETVDVGGPTSGSSNTALADGIIRPAEDVGAYRAQLLDSLCGKIVRIDPATGDGVADNPFYDAQNPRSPRSRVWALGLRNPFRLTLRPGSGFAGPVGQRYPGVLYVGDVGWNAWEELNLCRGGENFGWPAFEGMEEMWPYFNAAPANLDAPNPLFGQGGCTRQYFDFNDLIIQDTLNPSPSFPNPCNPNQQVPAGTPHFVHTRPDIDWYHAEGPSRTKTYIGQDPDIANIGDPGSPVQGPQFGGFCSTAGAWYTGSEFPAEYQGTYFHGDYAAGWIRNLLFDVQDQPYEVRDFAPEASVWVVAMATSPADGGLYYIGYDGFGVPSVKRLTYFADDVPPTAVASAAPEYGPALLTVQFTGSDSSDPEGLPLEYAWDFGDGGPVGTEPDPVHEYPSPDITAQGSFLARVFELVPPHPVGGGNWDPAVMRDGDYPPVGNFDSSRQYDTYHWGDQGSYDYVGYAFSETHEFSGLIFQEGIHFWDGGWFDSFNVYVRSDSTWAAVGGLVVQPAYGGNDGETYEVYNLTFDPVVGDAIVILGNPGGSANFISVGELRVLEIPDANIPPTRYDVTLTVRDAVGLTDTRTIPVWVNNSPPTVQITSPADGTLYSMAGNTTLALTADVSDAEHGPGELSCAWQTILHHNEHTHPEPPDSSCTTTTVITPVGCGTETYFYEIRLTVADPLGAATSESVFLYPDCSTQPCEGDVNGDRQITLADLSILLTNFGTATGMHLDDGDLDQDGDVDLADLSALLTLFGGSCP
ncbi:MAG: PQQ-dependent sugar dehydrogenase [Phycisphaerae bacterium]|jgi:glucose/arabinose dehydrogenase